MNSFIYNNPTKVIFEENGIIHLEKALKEQNCKKILIVYGGKSAEKSGLLYKAVEYIEKAEIEYCMLSGVVPNPLLSKVNEGIELGKKEEIDFILAIGGGSVIDTAKAIGVGIKAGGDVWDFFEGKRTIEACIPVGCILTIPAAGSEMSTSSVITHDESLLKRSINFEGAICKFSILDPSLTLSLPDYQTFCGVTDIMMHTMERYFNTVENLELTDALAEGLLRTVIKYGKVLKSDTNNMEARWNIMWAGSLSHNGLMNCGNNKGDWSTHKIEHEIGGLYDVAHGAGLAAVWASWARYVVEVIPHRFEKMGLTVLDIKDTGDQLKNANLAIDEIEKFFEEIEMPITIKKLGVKPSEEEIILMADKATNYNNVTIGTVKKLDRDDIINIITNAL
ncbi:MAG: iron-containing alcohol dehydrogenase [bacterium]